MLPNSITISYQVAGLNRNTDHYFKGTWEFCATSDRNFLNIGNLVKTFIFDRALSPKKEVINCYLFYSYSFNLKIWKLSLHIILLIQVHEILTRLSDPKSTVLALWKSVTKISVDFKGCQNCTKVVWFFFTPENKNMIYTFPYWSFCSDSHDLHHTGTFLCFGFYFGCCHFISANTKWYGIWCFEVLTTILLMTWEYS